MAYTNPHFANLHIQLIASIIRLEALSFDKCTWYEKYLRIRHKDPAMGNYFLEKEKEQSLELIKACKEEEEKYAQK